MCHSNIFSKMLVFLRLRKKDEGKSHPFAYIQNDLVMFRSLSDCETDPWYRRVYWAIYRYFNHSPWGSPRRIYNETKFILQRARRGWADSDTWSLDCYLDSWMPAALRHLKEHKHGVPSCIFLPVDLIVGGDWQGNPSDEGMVRAEARWDAIMDKMIEAFEASACPMASTKRNSEATQWVAPQGYRLMPGKQSRKAASLPIAFSLNVTRRFSKKAWLSSSRIITRCGIEKGLEAVWEPRD